MKKRKSGFLIAVAIFLVLSLIACSSSPSGGETGSGGDDGKLKKVGMSVITLNNPYFVSFQNSLEEAAKKQGFEAIIESADGDLAKQQAQIENFITQGVDVILLNAVDSAGVAGAVQQAKEAGIPVIAVDVGAKGGVTATVTSNNYQAGKLAGEYLVEQLNGKGNVVLINGTPITSIFERVRGFKDAIKDHPGIKIIAEQNGKINRDDSYRVFTNILSSHNPGEIDAVFGVNDPTSIGAYLAAQSAGRDGFFIVSVDGSKAACDLIKKGDMFAMTAAQHPGQEVKKALEIAKKVLAGEDYKEKVKVPVDSVTDENVDEYVPWG